MCAVGNSGLKTLEGNNSQGKTSLRRGRESLASLVRARLAKGGGGDILFYFRSLLCGAIVGHQSLRSSPPPYPLSPLIFTSAQLLSLLCPPKILASFTISSSSNVFPFTTTYFSRFACVGPESFILLFYFFSRL